MFSADGVWVAAGGTPDFWSEGIVVCEGLATEIGCMTLRSQATRRPPIGVAEGMGSTDSVTARGRSQGAGLGVVSFGSKAGIAGAGLRVAADGASPTDPAMTPCIAAEGVTNGILLSVWRRLSMNTVLAVPIMITLITIATTAAKLRGCVVAGSLTETISPIWSIPKSMLWVIVWPL